MIRPAGSLAAGEYLFLRRTPAWAPAALYLLISFYIARQGIEGITRLAAFVFPLTFVLSFLVILFSMENLELDNIRPVFFFESGRAVAAGTANQFSPFMVLLTALLVNPYLTRKDKTFPALAGATALASLLLLLTIVSGIGTYGAEGILRAFPFLNSPEKPNSPHPAILCPAFQRHLAEPGPGGYRILLLSPGGRGSPMVARLELQMVYLTPPAAGLFP